MKSKVGKQLAKHSYLLRIFLTVFLLLYIPAMLMGLLIVRHSFAEMQESNHSFYRENVRAAAQDFKELTASFVVTAQTLGIEHKISRHVVESNAYEVIAASEALAGYRSMVPAAADMGIYFTGADYLLTTRYKYNLDDFAAKYAPPGSEAHRRVLGFFAGGQPMESYVSAGEDSGGHALLFGVPIHLSRSSYKDAVVFFVFSQRSLEQSFFQPAKRHQNLCIFREDGALLYDGSQRDGLFRDPAVLEFALGEPEAPLDCKSEDLYLYQYRDPTQGLIFLSVISKAAAETNLLLFYGTLQTILIISALMMIVVLLLIVAINYKPIFRLSSKIREDPDIGGLNVSEIRLIEEFFSRTNRQNLAMSEQVSEQQLWLIDHMLHEILRGNPVPEEELHILNLDRTESACAMVAATGPPMGHVEREELLERLLADHILAYILDFPAERHMGFFCILPAGLDGQALADCVRRGLEPYGHYRVGVGGIVRSVGQIRDSYMTALAESQAGFGPVAYHTHTDIAAYADLYPVDELVSLLQYVQQGHREQALACVCSLADIIGRLEQPAPVKRYACNQILSELTKALHKAGQSVDAADFQGAVQAAGEPLFHDAVARIVERACDSMLQARRDSEESFVKELVAFVDANCMSEDMTLMSVADHFHVSIYTMSRMFKDATDCRFKEYVTDKRIGLGKHLLLTTDLSIKQIAARTGLNNADYFGRLFKQRYGASPSAFRSGAAAEEQPS